MFFILPCSVEVAWKVDSIPLYVFSDSIKLLLFNESIDEGLLHYYTYKRKAGAAKDSESKYIPFSMLQPSAFTHLVEKRVSSIEDEIIRAIENMGSNTEKLIIPINTSKAIVNGQIQVIGEHWHLLVYVVDTCEWQHFNSVRSNTYKSKYLEDAKNMADYCQPHINKWCQKNNRRQNINSDVNFTSMEVPEQGCNPDCLLYLCYWFKRSVKPSKPMITDPQYLMEVMQNRRVTMAYKLLTAKYPEKSMF
ncbi:hypothetical protein MKW94_005652 [Papaver nudicaule]|uniref:Ubiquitin-like protease family profile domain-containing protein n=1 Tax=Papaver nudicaule TaxID=74823 RepID=A0AA42AWC0_PAPNU|nr:hypothetical protein [Papaver nudicaule]